MKKLIALLLALIMVLSLAACGAKSEEPAAEEPAAEEPAAEEPAAEEPAAEEPAAEPSGEVETVTYLCSVGAYLNVLEEEINKWNEGEGKDLGVYIDLTSEINNNTTVFEGQMQAGNYMDIADGLGSNAPAYVLQGWLKDLETIDDPELKEMIESYRPFMLEGLSYVSGMTVALPLEVVPIKMAVNTDLFEKNNLELPKTWADVVEAAKVITENGDGTEFGYGGTTWGAYYRRLAMKGSMSSTETGWWDPNTATYSFAQYEIPITSIREMYQNGWVLGMDDLGIDEIRAQFAAGKVGMFPAPGYDVSVYTNQFPAECNWTVIDMPTYEEGDAPYKGVYLDRVNSYIIAPAYDNATPEHQKAVIEAFKFLNSDELYATIYANGGMIPYKQEIIENTEVLVDIPQWALMADISNYTSMFIRPDSILPLEGDTYEIVFSSIVHGDLEWNDEVIGDLEQRYNDAYQAAKDDPDIDTSMYEYAYDHSK